MAQRGRPAKIRPNESMLGSPYQLISPVKPTDEFVARSSTPNPFWSNYNSFLSRLPRATDDLGVELTPDLLNRMMNDAQISSAIYTLVHQAMSQGIRVKTRYRRGHEYYKRSVEMYDFISYNLEFCMDGTLNYMSNSLTEVVEDMAASSVIYGNSVAEITTRLGSVGKTANKMILASIKPKPIDVYAFVVDAFGNVVGIAVYVGKKESDGLPPNAPAYIPSPSNAVSIADLDFPADQLADGWEILPIGKFMVTTHRMKNGDPRGQSALRQAFNPWFLQMQLWPEYLKYLTQFASPSIDCVLPENPLPEIVDGVRKRPEEIMAAALEDFQNGSYIVRKYGSELELLWSQNDGSAFTSAISILDHQKVKAILHSLLATETSNNQTRAASSTHKDIMDLPTRALKARIAAMVERQLFKKLIYFNFGQEAAEFLTPRCSLGRITPEDRNEGIKAWSAAGMVITPSQYGEVCAELEIEEPTEEELGVMFKKLETEAAPKPAASAGGNGDVKPGARK